MATRAAKERDAFDSAIVDEFRANGGRVGGPLADTPILLLHHIGARSELHRVTPLVYSPQPEGRYVIVASNGGSPTHPGWYHNLKARPRVKVEVGTETFWAQAEELHGLRHDALLSQLVATSPSLRDYQLEAGRPIPIFLLTRRDTQAR